MGKKIFVGFFLSIILSIVIGMNAEQAEAASYHEDAIAEAENHLGLSTNGVAHLQVPVLTVPVL